MLDTTMRKTKWANILYIIFGALILGVGALLNPVNHYLGGFFVSLSAIVLYFYIVLFVAQKNWLDIRAVFAGVWLFTIGLASLRLLDYQEPWQAATWLHNGLAYIMFQIGILVGLKLWVKIYEKLQKIKFRHLYVEMREQRLWGACVIVTLIGLVCFAINVYIRGYIPFFSSDTSAYVTFHTIFNLFSIASTMISGLCYYCIVTQKIAIWKKVILVLCIIFETVLYPTLIVSRGIFLASALSLITAIFYLHKRKLWVLLTSLIVIFGIYLVLSSARGYTDEQLNIFFEPSKIEIEPEKEDPDNENPDNENHRVFVLPPKVAFVYTYLTVSHDNFNEAVQNAEEYTYGLRQLAPINIKPFNLIFDFSAIEEATSGEYYLVRPHLNTINLIGNFYYDLRGFGIALFMLLWGCVFGMIQICYQTKKGPFALVGLGNTMTPIALCFFSPWTNLLQFWVLWGTGWILWVMVCVHFYKKIK